MVNMKDPSAPEACVYFPLKTKLTGSPSDDTFCHVTGSTATSDVIVAVRTAFDPYTTLVEEGDKVTEMLSLIKYKQT